MSEITHKYIDLYGNLFTFGSFSKVLSTFIIFYGIYTSILFFRQYFSIGFHINVLSLTSFLIPIFFLIVDFIVVRFVWRDRAQKIFSLRRLLGKYYVFFLIGILYLLLSIIPIRIFGVSFLFLDLFSLVSIAIFVDLIVFIPLLYNGLIRSILLVVAKIFLVVFLLAFYYPFEEFLYSTIISFIPMVIVPSFYKYIDGLSGKVGVVKGPLLDYLKGYLDSWMLDDPKYLDKLLEHGSIDIKSRIDTIIFPDAYPNPVSLIIPYFHFGPFKNVGSSSFPALVSSYMYLNKKLNAVVFHTPSTHELDISSNDELMKIIEGLGEFRNPIVCSKISSIHKAEYGDAVAYGLRFCSNILLFLEYKEMEDIPYHVISEIEKYAREKGFNNISIIDCHNSLVNKSLVLEDKAIEELITASKILIDKLRRVSLYRYKISHVKVFPPHVSSIDGIGSNGISLLYFETISSSNCIITIDSNNLSPLLKKEIQYVLKSHNIDNYVICTTDTHEVTAIDLVEGGYRVLGEEKEVTKHILDAIDRGLTKAKTLLKSSDIHFYRNEFTAKVLGYDLIEKLGELSVSAFRKFRYFIIIAPIILVTLSILFPFIVL